MLRKIINLIVVLAVIVAISGIFIHLYNNSKNKPTKFDNLKETISNKSSKKNKNKKETNNNKSKDSIEKDNREEESNQENDGNETTEGNNNETDTNNNNSGETTNASEVAVASTGTKENIYLSIIGGIIIITGTGIITLKINKDRI